MSLYRKEKKHVEITAYYALHLNRFQMTAHRHPACEIMCLTAGSCTVVTEKERVLLKERQFIFLDAFVPHELIVEEGANCSLLNVEFVCHGERGHIEIGNLWEKSPVYSSFVEKKKAYLVGTDMGKLVYAMKDFISELEREEKDVFLQQLIFQRMLLELAGCEEKIKSGQGQLHLKRAKEYIHQHFAHELYVEQIAAEIGINHSYLQTLFSEYERCGLNAYVNRLRMEKSAYLLKNSKMPIVDIAVEAGFNSRQHFGYTFLKHFQMRPREYRQLYGQHMQTDTKKAQLFS